MTNYVAIVIHRQRQERAYIPEPAFPFPALQASGRLILANSLEDAASQRHGCFEQPCVGRMRHLKLGVAKTMHTYVFMVYVRYFWQGNHQIYGHIQCTYTVQANPTCSSLQVCTNLLMPATKGAAFQGAWLPKTATFGLKRFQTFSAAAAGSLSQIRTRVCSFQLIFCFGSLPLWIYCLKNIHAHREEASVVKFDSMVCTCLLFLNTSKVSIKNVQTRLHLGRMFKFDSMLCMYVLAPAVLAPSASF
jgi:hypothetical protein